MLNSTILKPLIHLVWPPLCPGCQRVLLENEPFICLHCREDLPRTNFHHLPDNPVMKMLAGRAPVKAATSYLLFKKGGKVQRMVHDLKYKGNRKLGEELGGMFAGDLKEIPDFMDCDAVVPVPLSAKRLKKRGYNQSDFIALGIANRLNMEFCPNLIERVHFSKSQTRMGRIQRLENLQKAFKVKSGTALSYCKVLLIDDVITTGATLEVCATKLKEAGIPHISVATLACTLH